MPSEFTYNAKDGVCVCGVQLSRPYSNDGKVERFARHLRKLGADDIEAIKADPEKRRNFSDTDLVRMLESGLCPFDRGQRG